MFATVEFSQILEVIWVSLVAGIGVTAIYSVVIYGVSRAAEARREGNGGEATMYGVVAMVAFALFAAGLIFGLSIVLNK